MLWEHQTLAQKEIRKVYWSKLNVNPYLSSTSTTNVQINIFAIPTFAFIFA